MLLLEMLGRLLLLLGYACFLIWVIGFIFENTMRTYCKGCGKLLKFYADSGHSYCQQCRKERAENAEV